MRFRDGSLAQKTLCAALIGLFALSMVSWVDDKLRRVGQPDIGWTLDGFFVAPTRADAESLGVNWGSYGLQINGVDLEGHRLFRINHPLIRQELGEVNVLVLRRPEGGSQEIRIPVRSYTWMDVLYSEGVNTVLGILFFLVGVIAFVLRPYTPGGWALLTMCAETGSLLTNFYMGRGATEIFQGVFFRNVLGFLPFVILHLALAFPVVHPILLRRRLILVPIYAFGTLHSAIAIAGWWSAGEGPFRYTGGLDTVLLSASVAIFTLRCGALAFNTTDPLVAQRARIVLFGALFGVVPPVALNLVRNIFQTIVFDPRIVLWSLGIFLASLGYLTLRHDMMNARRAVRAAIVYGITVGVLTAAAVLLVSVRPYAVAILIVPLLYWWPRFNAELNAWVYPKRRQFPVLIREIGIEMAAASSVDEVLDSLAQAPLRLLEARSCVAVLFQDVAGPIEHVRGTGAAVDIAGERLEDDPLIQMVVMTRQEIFRESIAVEPQYSNIRNECYACLDRLDADVLIPILKDQQVVGVVAMGPSATADVYAAPDLLAFSTLAQQAVQAVIRVEATERLRERELEFADLKRFFPPQIIDQIMAKGGASELRSQRKRVTVFFADFRGFTSFSDRVEPEEVMTTLAEYHTCMGGRIAEFRGTLERFTGDGFMVFFNDPLEQPDHVERAVRMASAMREDVDELRKGWARKGYPIDVGMGIHTGYATVGFIGYEGRRDYGVIGNVTNLAARLSDKAEPGEILISSRVRGELGDEVPVEPVGPLELKGFQQPQEAFRLRVPTTDPTGS